ncbi:MAG: transcriptional repressor [Desulfoprunum sp.]|nr:transcriptional repressor [Desulfoprunum sp.]
MPLRMTNQREIILEELKKTDQHLNADELYERVRLLVPRISLATVYRNLELLTELGIVTKLEISGRPKRYDFDVGRHDHIFCIECHRIDNIEVKCEEIAPAVLIMKGEYSITGYRLEFVGICPKCQGKRHKEKK